MKSFIDVSYVNPDDGLRKMDVFAPENSKRTVMWMHGGGLETGSRKGFDGIARQLCEEGTAFISVEYRMYPGHSFPSFIEDGAMAASYILSHARAWRFRAYVHRRRLRRRLYRHDALL